MAPPDDSSTIAPAPASLNVIQGSRGHTSLNSLRMYRLIRFPLNRSFVHPLFARPLGPVFATPSSQFKWPAAIFHGNYGERSRMYDRRQKFKICCRLNSSPEGSPRQPIITEDHMREWGLGGTKTNRKLGILHNPGPGLGGGKDEVTTLCLQICAVSVEISRLDLREKQRYTGLHALGHVEKLVK